MNTDKSYLVFRYINCRQDQGSNIVEPIFIQGFEKSQISIINTVIDKRIDFSNVHIAKLNLKGSNVTGTLNRINLKAESKNWETACILKNEELKRNNTIKALEYHAEEKEHYMKELKKKGKIVDLMSLMLSKIVNNHGQNWFQALCFTISVPVFAYTLFSLPNDLFVPILLSELGLVAVVSFIAFFKLISKLCEKINLRITSILGKKLGGLCNIISNMIFNKQTLLCTFYLSSIGILFHLGIEPIDLGTHLGELIDYFVPTSYNPLKSYVKGISIRGILFLTTCGISVYMVGKIALPYGIYEVYKAFRKYR